MATYEFRCTVCDERFEVRRPMIAADDPASCPAGHTETRRLLSVFAAMGTGASPASGPTQGGVGFGGCGAGCGCSAG